MRMIRSTLALTVLGLATVTVLGQQVVDVNALGPKVGDRAIDFRLQDQNGQPRTLSSVAGPRGTMLVFFRSSDW